MNFFLGALLLLGYQGELDTYHLQIDPEYLDQLYENPYEDLSFPAYVETPAGACSCMAGFRGGTSLDDPKKSWKLVLADTSLMHCYHILLDAQYSDKTFMRNALGLAMSRELGLPSPLTQHVSFYINGTYYGVYVKVERIDSYFYSRNGIPDGPLFKCLSHQGRMVWLPADLPGTSGFDAERGCDEELYLVRALIDRLNLGLQHGVDEDDVISNAAIAMAIFDEDAINKNFYIHYMPDGTWRYYPWDRNASFGNDWNGDYDPDWIQEHGMLCFNVSPLLNRLLREQSNRELYHQRIMEISDIMENRLPAMIDSIYSEIRESVYADTMKNGSNQDFDDAVDVLRAAVVQRAQYLPNIADVPSPITVDTMYFSQWQFPSSGSGESVEITVKFQQEPSCAGANIWSDGGDSYYCVLSPQGSSGLTWKGTWNFPGGISHARFAITYSIDTPEGLATYYYPAYGYALAPWHRVCAPTIRRSSFAVNQQYLDVLGPVRYTPFLWYLPLVNGDDEPMDLSFYGIQVGDPPARIFLPDNTILQPGDTMFVTNNDTILEMMLPGNSMVFGNLVTDSISSTMFNLLDPTWAFASGSAVGSETECQHTGGKLIVSEICHNGPCGDWVELFNAGYRNVDLSGCIMLDAAQHSCLLPQDLSLAPGCFVVICQSLNDFMSYYSGDINAVEALGFGLNGETDGITILKGDQLVLSLIYDSQSWPLDGNILYLDEPAADMLQSCNWISADLPGTPGAPNPGWPAAFYLPPRIEGLWPNPAESSVNIEYSLTAPGEITLFDLAGRMVRSPQYLNGMDGTVSIELPSELNTGIYFAVIRSMGAVDARRLVLIR